MKYNITFALFSAALLSSCTMTNIRDSFGAKKQMPDEFLVETRNNLVIPEKFDLPDPAQAGIPNLDRNNDAARRLLTGGEANKNAALGTTEKNLLQKADAANETDDIKKTVYLEHKENKDKGVFGVKKGGMLETILDPFGYNAPKDPELDIEAEKKRVQKAIQDGKKISGDDVIIKQ